MNSEIIDNETADNLTKIFSKNFYHPPSRTDIFKKIQRKTNLGKWGITWENYKFHK